MKRDGRAIVASDLHHQVELALPLIIEHVEKILSRRRIHRLAAGKNFRRRHRLLVLDRTAANDDIAAPPKLPEQQINRTPSRNRAQSVQAAGESGLLMISIRR